MTPHERDRPLALVVCAHSFWNVPPLFNVAIELGKSGFRVIEVGYESSGRPPQQRLHRLVRILRLRLRSRTIKLTVLRKLFATLEFLWKSRAIIKRLQPDVLITFNEPASLLQAVPLRPDATKVSWILEHPEFELMSLPERIIVRMSMTGWSRADVVVAPTEPRLALHTQGNLGCLPLKTFIVENTPRLAASATPASDISPSTRDTIAKLDAAADRNLVRIVYTGAIGNRYAIDLIIEAVAKCENAFLLLLGGKHDLAISEVEAARARSAPNDRFAWVDEIPYDELQHVFPHADIGFAYYKGDSLNTRFSAPGKLYEYLKGGLAILSDNQCCVGRHLEAVGCGLLFQRPISIESMCELIDDAARNPEELRTKKSLSRKLFEERLSMEKNMEPFIAYLKNERNHNTPSP